MKKKNKIAGLFLNNWALKLFSLAAAFFLWLLVMTIENPEDQKVFYNIPVKLVNTEVLTDENMVYEILDKTDTVSRVSVMAKKSIRDELSTSDIVAEADFSNLTVANTVEIRFYSLRYNEQITSISGSNQILKLNIEKKKTKRLELQTEVSGEVAKGYIISDTTPDQNRIEISGPESVVTGIATARVTVDVTDAAGNISTYAEVKLYDASDKEIDKENLEINTSKVRVKVEILDTKTVPVKITASGTPAQGYLLNGTVTSTTENVTIAGSTESLTGIHEITIPEEALDVTDCTEDAVFSLNIKDYLPENVSLANRSASGRLTVIVGIEKEYESELQIKGDKIQFSSLPEGYTAEIVDLKDHYNLQVTGLKADIDSWKDSDIAGYISIKQLMDKHQMTELREGTYDAEVFVSVTGSITIVQPIKVQVKITAITEE